PQELNRRLGKAVHEVLQSVLAIQKHVLETTEAWIGKWEDIDAKTKGASAKQASSALVDNLAKIKLASERADEKGEEWTKWLGDRHIVRPALVPLSGAPSARSSMASFDLQAIDLLRDWWGAVLAAGSAASQLAARGASNVVREVLLPLYVDLLVKRRT